ncbi:hypothetical protein GCM10022416_25550 [Actinomadura keratinilytica]|uniref:Uncharacterized protein n=1 Tax=Actinomadura keratinilytica TaxID=547461 RepID=A0ABP7YPJ2_9ACTN
MPGGSISAWSDGADLAEGRKRPRRALAGAGPGVEARAENGRAVRGSQGAGERRTGRADSRQAPGIGMRSNSSGGTARHRSG